MTKEDFKLVLTKEQYQQLFLVNPEPKPDPDYPGWIEMGYRLDEEGLRFNLFPWHHQEEV